MLKAKGLKLCVCALHEISAHLIKFQLNLATKRKVSLFKLQQLQLEKYAVAVKVAALHYAEVGEISKGNLFRENRIF